MEKQVLIRKEIKRVMECLSISSVHGLQPGADSFTNAGSQRWIYYWQNAWVSSPSEIRWQQLAMSSQKKELSLELHDKIHISWKSFHRHRCKEPHSYFKSLVNREIEGSFALKHQRQEEDIFFRQSWRSIQFRNQEFKPNIPQKDLVCNCCDKKDHSSSQNFEEEERLATIK